MLVALLAVAVGLLAAALGVRWLWAGSGVAWDVVEGTARRESPADPSHRRPPARRREGRRRRQPAPDERRAALVRLVRGFVLLTLGLTAVLFGALGL